MNTANQKSGLNEAILGNIGSSEDPKMNADRIARLLREGAHSLVDERAADVAADNFQAQVAPPPLLAPPPVPRSVVLTLWTASVRSHASSGVAMVDDGLASVMGTLVCTEPLETCPVVLFLFVVARWSRTAAAVQDIGDILAHRTSRRVVQGGGKSGGTFSVASFRADGAAASAADTTGDDAAFWRDLLPEAVKAHHDAEARKLIVDGKRSSRRRVNYGEDGAAHSRAVEDDEVWPPLAPSHDVPCSAGSSACVSGGMTA